MSAVDWSKFKVKVFYVIEWKLYNQIELQVLSLINRFIINDVFSDFERKQMRLNWQ